MADWGNDPDYSHGFLVPVLSGYCLWERRHAFTQLSVQPSAVGLLLILLGIAMLLLGHVGAELFLMRVSMVILLAGLVLYHGGWPYVKEMAFPDTVAEMLDSTWTWQVIPFILPAPTVFSTFHRI